MTLAQCKKNASDPLLAIATTCLGVAATTVTVGMYVGATSTSTPTIAIPKTASVPPVEPPPPKLFATIPATNLAAIAPSQLAAKLVEPTSPAQRTPQVKKGRPDPFAPLFSDEQETQQVDPAPQPLPPKLAPPQSELQPPPAAKVRQVTQYASRIVLKGASEAEDGRSALVQLPGEPSPRFVNEGEIVKVGQGEVRFARIEEVDSSNPRIILEENGVEVVRALGQRPTKRNSSASQNVALDTSPTLHLQEPVTEAESPDAAIVPVPSLPPVGKSRSGGERLPSPPPLSDANETIRQKENNQLPASKPAKLGKQIVNQAVVAARSLPPAGVATPARQERVKLLDKLRQPRPRPVSIQERQQHLQQHPPFLLPVSSSRARAERLARLRDPQAGDKIPQFQERRLSERRQLVRRLRQSTSSHQPTSTTTGEQASSSWKGWQKIATFTDRTVPSSSE